MPPLNSDHCSIFLLSKGTKHQFKMKTAGVKAHLLSSGGSATPHLYYEKKRVWSMKHIDLYSLNSAHGHAHRHMAQCNYLILSASHFFGDIFSACAALSGFLGFLVIITQRRKMAFHGRKDLIKRVMRIHLLMDRLFWDSFFPLKHCTCS